MLIFSFTRFFSVFFFLVPYYLHVLQQEEVLAIGFNAETDIGDGRPPGWPNVCKDGQGKIMPRSRTKQIKS